MATKKKQTKKQVQEQTQWGSIVLFGICIFIAALLFVPGANAWAWIRNNVLFGVFGVSAYFIVPALFYFMKVLEDGRSLKAPLIKVALGLMLVSGTFLVFFDYQFTDMKILDIFKILFESGQVNWYGPGALSAILGGSLLALFGRPGANILLIILLVIEIMLMCNVTPGDIFGFLSQRVSDTKDKLTDWKEQRAQMRALQEEEEYIPQQLPVQPVKRKRAPAKAFAFDIDVEDYATTQKSASHKRSVIDIDLGDMPLHKVKKEEMVSPIGPGGSFGVGAVVAPQDSVGIVMPKVKAQTPSVESLVKKATGVKVQELSAVDDLRAQNEGYRYPPLSLFQKQKQVDEKGVEEELTHNADLLVKTLESFGVRTRLLDISRGPSVTRYELQPLAGVKISRITGLADDIALNLATAGVRIEAPIPGKAAVGIEIPNKIRSIVSIRSLLEAPDFATSKDPLTFVVGKDIAGNCQTGNLAKMPHLLIAGTTGSGKSVCTNSIIMSLLYRCSPQMMRMLLIDPKMVEFAQYNGIPHLLMPVVTEPRKAAGALGSAVAEMEKRYRMLAENGVPNIEEFNDLAAIDDSLEKMPYIVIIIDELADLMMVAGKEVEDYICRLAQKARAAGMHLIVATQRPSVDVITGLIKANIPSRVGLSVMSQIDSRTILDTGGAEKLLGNGDMLYMPVGINKPLRVQGTFVRSAEIRSVIDFIKSNSQPDYDEGMIQDMNKCAVEEKSGNTMDDDSRDPMLNTAVEVVLEVGQASTSLLQSRCRLGYARARRIIDTMEQMHLIGPSEGAKARPVLITRQQWIEMSMQEEQDRDPSAV